MANIIIFISLLLIGYFAGKYAESKHYSSIKERELKLLYLPVVTLKKTWTEEDQIKKSKLVTGSVVISLDYFKRILAALINITGGRIISYETLLDRGRREAILRMKKDSLGYDCIVNFRMETSSIGQSANNKKSIGSVEVMAYGTAVKFVK